MIRQLLPWFENLGKRQVKSPKQSLHRDSALLHALLGIGSRRDRGGMQTHGRSRPHAVHEHRPDRSDPA
jgi:hypothetical protein